MKRWLRILACLIATTLTARAHALILSDLRDWKIVCAPDAIPSEKYAAEEFRGIFKQITGAEIAITESAGEKEKAIFIGRVEGISTGPLGDEGLRIIIAENRIVITGGRPRGTLYGVYEFFERECGVRFLTFDHTYIPTVADRAALLDEDYTFIPTFSFRWSYYQENAAHPEFAAKLRVNTVTHDEKLGGVTPQNLIGHSFFRYCPVEKFGKEHPEYFAMIDGVRKLEGKGGGPELCVTNPEVVEIVAEGVIRDLDANPAVRNISVSQNDNSAYCRCDRCKAINDAEGTPMGANLQFINAVAERVEKKHPGVKVGTLAYWYSRKCPKTIAPRTNMQIQLCSIEACTFHALNDPRCERNRAFCSDLTAWKEKCQDIWIWNYNTDFRIYDLPFPNLRAIGSNVQFFAENNAKGVFMQANGVSPGGEMSDLRNYVISHCLWTPGLDSWALAGEFCRLHYMESAEPIMEWLTLIHDNAQIRGVHPGCFPKAEDVGLTPELAKKGMELFEKGMAEARTDELRARVEKASLTALRATLAVDEKARTDPAFIARYVETCNKYGVTNAGEERKMADYFEELQEGLAKSAAAK